MKHLKWLLVPASYFFTMTVVAFGGKYIHYLLGCQISSEATANYIVGAHISGIVSVLLVIVRIGVSEKWFDM